MVGLKLGGARGQNRDAKRGFGGIAVLREMSRCAGMVNTGKMEGTDVKVVREGEDLKIAYRSSPTGRPCEAAEGATVA
jgi:hypothetical protein